MIFSFGLWVFTPVRAGRVPWCFAAWVYTLSLLAQLRSSGLGSGLGWIVHMWFPVGLVKVKVTQLCLTLCNPIDCIVHGILQARILQWVAVTFSRESSQPRDRSQVSHIAGGFLTTWATRKSPVGLEMWSSPDTGLFLPGPFPAMLNSKSLYFLSSGELRKWHSSVEH